MNIIEAIQNPKLFRQYFDDLTTWSLWLTLLKGAFAIEMTPEELVEFQKYTDRTKSPAKEVETLVLVAGRRSGKSFMSSVIACFLGLFYDYRPHLSSGEWAVIQIIASDRSQAGVIFKYISAILNENPTFAKMIVNETKQSISLSTRVQIEVQTCSFRSLRGRTLVCCICDELAFWYSEGQKADVEVIRSIRPAMLTVPNSKLIMISSPYSQRGVLFQYFKDNWGKNKDDILVWRSASLELNPTLDEATIQKALEEDRESASAEFLAAWRKDLSTFLSAELVDELVISGRYELEPIAGKQYVGFVDSAGGSGVDAYSMAVAHVEDDMLVLDCLRYKDPPFDPFAVTEEFSRVFKDYWVDTVHGDRYTGSWVETAYRQHDIRYVASILTKSEIYLACEPHFSRRQIELLNDERLSIELKNLERRTRKIGRDVVDHGIADRDDASNAACGAIYLASQCESNVIIFDPYQERGRVIAPIN
jgi:hypothetical protein